MSNTHLTPPTQFVEVDGDQFAYRHWGSTPSSQRPAFFVHARRPNPRNQR